MSRAKTFRAIGQGILWISLLLLLLAGWLAYDSTRSSSLIHHLQHGLSHSEVEMQSILDQGVDLETGIDPSFGLLVFSNDSLIYWNTNELNPKLLRRRVRIGHDTICSINSGDYYIKSLSQGPTSYYLFRLINSTYHIENQYFTNRCLLLPQWIEASVGFGPNLDGAALYNKDGKVLSNCQIFSSKVRGTVVVLVVSFLLLMVVVGVVLVHRSPTRPKKELRSGFFEIGMIAIMLLSMIGTYVFYRVSSDREKDRIKNMAAMLAEKRDLRFEKSFAGFAELVKTDSDFNEMVFSESNVLADVLLDYSKELLFDETMNGFLVTLTLCSPEEEITIQPDGYSAECNGYFMDQLSGNPHLKVCEGLYYLDYYTLDPNYMGVIPMCSADSLRQKTLYFEFYKPLAPEGFGFPQLLQEDHSQKPYDYSVANYRDSLLVYKYGQYTYPNFLENMKVTDQGFSYGKRYQHYAIRHGENDLMVISTPRKGWTEITAPFALFYLGLMIPYLLVIWFIRPRRLQKWRDRSFRHKLQTVILMTLVISFFAIGPLSVVFMRSLYNQKTMETQFETTRTLSLEMRNDLDFASLSQTTQHDYWSEQLQQFANTFFTDLNLYQLNGQLLATTRPEIYELNLLAPLMDAEAYQNIHRNKALYYTHEEHLGKGTFESVYVPLTDATGHLIAYLNTPYFASSADLQKEIQNFVLTYVNIILVLLSIALLFVLGITRRLTQPLSLIQNKLGGLRIDQKNEPIEWKGNDEIGALVKQYNQLIVELEKSANELRRTTTESAWRGVARQVAHEIHNSLTPMRLSVQMLQRSAEQQDGMADGRIQRTTTTLLEQIDALSDIASSFSQYAKLPVNNPQPLDLAELVSNLVNLYDNADNIEFHLEVEPGVDYTFNGDKTNLNSAIGNIIKNATQAIGLTPNGRIGVSLRATETSFAISVKDNGKGIKEEDKKMIFVPNFTTKTGGSGVGLSLAYNIILSAGGSISFESQEGVGTEFIIDLPRETQTSSK